MTRIAKVWWALAVLFLLVNVGGMVYAVMLGEAFHAATHAVLLLPAVYIVQRLVRRRGLSHSGSAMSAPSPEYSGQLTHLEQSLDAVAIEVERIGEGQRFMTRLFTEHGAPRAQNKGDAKPADTPGSPRDDPKRAL